MNIHKYINSFNYITTIDLYSRLIYKIYYKRHTNELANYIWNLTDIKTDC